MPPPRPPAPKLSFKSKQGSEDDAPMVSIRFSASSSMDYDNDVITESPIEIRNKSGKPAAASSSASSDSSAVNLNRRSRHDSKEGAASKDAEANIESKIALKRQSTSGYAGESVRNGDNVAQSAPVSQVTTPDQERRPDVKNSNSLQEKGFSNEATKEYIPQMTQVSQEEEKSLFSGIKEKLQDRFHDNLHGLIGKIEEIKGDSSIGEAIERRLRKSDSLDSNKSYTSAQSVTSSQASTVSKKDASLVAQERSLSRDVSVENDVFEAQSVIDATKLPPQKSTLGSIRSSQSAKSRTPNVESRTCIEKSRTPSLEFSEDFYAEPDDFLSASTKLRTDSTAVVGIATNSSQVPFTNGDSKHSKVSIRKHSTKYKAPPPPLVSIETSKSVPVSMSALLSHTEKYSSLSDDSPDVKSSTVDKSEYFDTKEDVIFKDVKPAPEPKPQLKESSLDKEQLKTKNIVASQDNAEREQSPELNPCPAVTQKRLVISFVCLAFYMIVPLPSYIAGMISGAVLATIGWFLYQWITAPPLPREPFVMPSIRDLPPLSVPRVKFSNSDETKFKGWMNELPHYDPDNYHISHTKSVFVQLEGTTLRLQTPKQSVAKRAMWNDQPITNVSFIKQRHFDLTGSKVLLLPPGLVRKRIWSKKYPICISLAKLGKKRTVKDTSSAKSLGFEVLPQELCDEGLLFLFARTGREKEEWYRRFEAATLTKPLPTQMTQLISKLENQPDRGLLQPRLRAKCTHSSSVPDSLTETSYSSLTAKHSPSFESDMAEMTMIVSNKESDEEIDENSPESNLLQYLSYMSRIMPGEHIEGKQSDNQTRTKSSRPNSESSGINTSCDAELLWVNAAVGRLFLDFLREQYWAGKVKDKIEKKLSKIHVPYFIDQLTVTDIELGSQMPVIQRASKPYIDERGLWVDLDVAYGGGFQMTLETKVNLMKLKKNPTSPIKEEILFYDKRSAVTNSDEEDSAESSTDEETEEESTIESGGIERQTQGASKKILKIVDKIAASKYFQHATEYKYVKKAMEGVSNTKLVLTVEIESCTGTVALNIPPPPTDRIWYGFRTNPKLVLSAKPRIGERDVSLTHVTDWIEKKLAIEFQRVLVLPNMDDLVFPIMFAPVENCCESPTTNGTAV